MTSTPCPNCEGFCCRADSDITVEHRVNKYTRHVCPDCNDGTVPEPCPTCEGWCCRGIPGMSAMHLSVRNAKHVCPDCEDGTELAPRPVRTAEDERADVVAYLAHARAFPFTHASGIPAVLDALYDLIVQGKHEGWAKKATEKGA